MRIRVIGGGLAGPEAALMAAAQGAEVLLYEMRPVRKTPAHQTADFGELVCSNSLKSERNCPNSCVIRRSARSPLADVFFLAQRHLIRAEAHEKVGAPVHEM
jgi:methylenetetrahydrofolate--tRNA-(uracil-5-)-methyltransferase